MQKTLREAGIPHTFINYGALWAPLAQKDIIERGNIQSPRDKLTILGDGHSLVVASHEVDIATLTVKAAGDPRTLNNQLVIRHKPNLVTFNMLVEIWEKKLSHSLHNTIVPEAKVQKGLDGLSLGSYANFIEAIMWEHSIPIWMWMPMHSIQTTSLLVWTNILTILLRRNEHEK